MAFWTDATRLEPKRQFKFGITIPNELFGDGVLFYAKTCDKPGFSLGEEKISYLNYDFKFPGRVTWSDVAMTLNDPTEPDVAFAVGQILEGSGYIIPGSPNSLTTISKRRAVGSLGNVIIEQIDTKERVVEKWVLNNAWIKDAKFGQLDYGQDGFSEVSLTFSYDWAEFESVDGFRLFYPSEI